MNIAYYLICDFTNTWLNGGPIIERNDSITMPPCTCVNNTSCNQQKVVLEPEIPAPRGKEWQSGMGTLELLAVYTLYPLLSKVEAHTHAYTRTHITHFAISFDVFCSCSSFSIQRNTTGWCLPWIEEALFEDFQECWVITLGISARMCATKYWNSFWTRKQHKFI